MGKDIHYIIASVLLALAIPILVLEFSQNQNLFKLLAIGVYYLFLFVAFLEYIRAIKHCYKHNRYTMMIIGILGMTVIIMFAIYPKGIFNLVTRIVESICEFLV
ncbi:hypothetical protein [Clostridium hydrogeniformans]|uniref:hypothetical protein n=1 Tax=Clostridium hydrogeniformans TaxID=349933 RepID=UPI00048305E1|nr:hypothetical protein [Clostridium hydrogeniformans]